MSNGVKLDIDNFLLGDRARFLLLEGEQKLFALESFLSVFTSLFCLQTLEMT